MTTNPGLAGQTRLRTFLRVLGVVLLGAGLVLAIKGGTTFYHGATSDSVDDNSGFLGIAMLAAGGFMAVCGLAAVNAGFMGVMARYTAGETMPVVKDGAAYLSDGRGVLGVGRTADDKTAGATGPYCRSCGARNDEDAKFCDGCGTSLG